MSSFTDPLTVTKLDAQLWRIETAFEFYLDYPDGECISIPEGFETDFTSVPRVFWGLFPPATGNYVQAAVIHDFLSDGGAITIDGEVVTIPKGNEINRIFLSAMKTLNTPWYKRYTLYYSVCFYFNVFRREIN